MSIKTVLGTMNFGPQVNLEDSDRMVDLFLSSEHNEIDTAYVYNKGDSELFLGQLFKKLPRTRFRIATKVNPRVTGKLDQPAISGQLNESLERMGLNSVDLLYLHFPDPNTPLEETLQACADLQQAGKFHNLGLSNFSAEEVANVCNLSTSKGWPQPVVYQGLYNALSRKVEKELFPVLRQHGISFYAYNPLAGGILAGKYKNCSDTPAPGRFTVRPNYKDRYWKKSFFDALDILQEACRTACIPLVQAAYRWLAHHSSLNPEHGDAVILGASSMHQLEQNLLAFNTGPLPASIISAFEAAWQATRDDAPDYARTSI